MEKYLIIGDWSRNKVARNLCDNPLVIDLCRAVDVKDSKPGEPPEPLIDVATRVKNFLARIKSSKRIWLLDEISPEIVTASKAILDAFRSGNDCIIIENLYGALDPIGAIIVFLLIDKLASSKRNGTVAVTTSIPNLMSLAHALGWLVAEVHCGKEVDLVGGAAILSDLFLLHVKDYLNQS